MPIFLYVVLLVKCSGGPISADLFMWGRANTLSLEGPGLSFDLVMLPENDNGK